MVDARGAELAGKLHTGPVTELVAVDPQPEPRRAAGLEPREPMCLLVARGGDPTQQRALALTVSTLLGEGSLVGTHDGAVGNRNIAAASSQISLHGLQVAFQDVGGSQGRRLSIDCDSRTWSVVRVGMAEGAYA